MLQLYLVLQGKAQLEHISDIVNVGVEATCWHFKPWRILKKTTEPADQFGTIPQEPWHPGKDAKPDHVIQSTAGKCAPMQVVKQPEHGRTSTTE